MRIHRREIGAAMCGAALLLVTHAAPPATVFESVYYSLMSLGLLISGRRMMQS